MNIYRNPFIVGFCAPLYQLVATIAITNDFLMAAIFIMFTLGLIGAYVSDFPLLPTLYMNEVAHKTSVSSLMGMLLGLMLLFSWMGFVGVVRAEFLRARNLDFVRAARALGTRDRTLIWRHVLPNAMVATITFMPFTLSASITTLTSLDFLGFGLPPGSPSLGELLNQGKSNLQAPWLGISGFVVIALMLSLLVFIGEATRDAFDPRKVYR